MPTNPSIPTPSITTATYSSGQLVIKGESLQAAGTTLGCLSPTNDGSNQNVVLITGTYDSSAGTLTFAVPSGLAASNPYFFLEASHGNGIASPSFSSPSTPALNLNTL